MEKDDYGLGGLPQKSKNRQLNIGAWANGAAAVLFLTLFLKEAARDCVPIEKWEQSQNAQIELLKEQLKVEVNRDAKKQAESVVLPRVKEVQRNIDTLTRAVDSLNNRGT